MALRPGTRLGSYEVVAPLGAGGMGEVYRARDSRLGREVAIKVLPEAFLRDLDRLARLEREARLLASLNHPGIAAIHGFEEQDGLRFLVLELVPGETLAERIRREPLTLLEGLAVCRQVSEALEDAHAQGVVHRDLKPANIKLTPDGRAKVLDFGLAKALTDEGSAEQIEHSPTMTRHATSEGVILGTAAYMSPEQARGKPLDRRTDIWSFGCVLYECLTTRQAFGGETASDVMAAVLGREPDWSALADDLPTILRSLLRRCLQKDKARRLHDIADARIEIEEAVADLAVGASRTDREATGERKHFGLRDLVQILGGGLLAGLAVGTFARWPGTAPETRLPMRLSIDPPPEVTLVETRNEAQLAISPDGTQVVYLGEARGARRLYRRQMNRLESIPLPGTEGGYNPFFSPDGQSVGFGAGGKLRKVSLRTGESTVICDAPSLRGGSWGPDDTILFTPGVTAGLFRVPVTGGTPTAVTIPDDRQASGHRWPDFLPGGNAALFATESPTDRDEERTIGIVSLKTGATRPLIQNGTYPRYLATGHVIYWRAGELMAAPFDLRRLELTGPAVPVLESVRMLPKSAGAAYFALSSSGPLVYSPESAHPPERQLVWVDRRGHAELLTTTRRAYLNPALSPDGQRLAVTVLGSDDDIWACDLARDAWTRLVSGGDNWNATWSPDGKSIAFSSARSGWRNVYSVAADGSGPVAQVLSLQSERMRTFPTSFTPGGRTLAVDSIGAQSGGYDVGMLDLGPERGWRPFLATPFNEGMAMFSPDGHYLAYTSDESGRPEIYVTPYPSTGTKWPISSSGGLGPVWAKSGKELFYRDGDKMMAVPVHLQPSFSTGSPQVLFSGHVELVSTWRFRNYDVTPDGQRFVMVKNEEDTRGIHLVVIPDFVGEMKARLSTGKK